MIKHDYKPQNNKQLFVSTNKSRFSARLFHPFVITAMAICVLMLGIVLSKTDKTTQTLMVVEDVNKAVELSKQKNDVHTITLDSTNRSKQPSQITHTVSDKNYTAPISIPLEIKASNIETNIDIPTIETKWQSETVKKGDSL